MGFLDTGGNVSIIWLHGDNVGPQLQGVVALLLQLSSLPEVLLTIWSPLLSQPCISALDLGLSFLRCWWAGS